MLFRLSTLFRIAGLPLICSALFALAGGHWALFQAIASVQMLRDNLRDAPIAEAVAKTFSGHYPCDMCTKISEQRQKEESSPAAAKFDKKAEIFVITTRDALRGPKSRDYSYFSPGETAPAERSDAPAAPIPI